MADVIYVGGKTYVVTRVETTYGTDAAGTDDKMQLVTNFTIASATLSSAEMQAFLMNSGSVRMLA